MSDFLKNIGESIGINKSYDLDSLKNIQRIFPSILNTRVLMLLTFLTVAPLSSITQNDSLEKKQKGKRVDSLENIVNNTNKENKLKEYINLIEEAWKLSPDTAIQYIHEMLSFAKKNEDKQSEAKAYDYLGKYDAYYGQSEDAIKNYEEELKIIQSLASVKDKEVGSVEDNVVLLNKIANQWMLSGKYDKAIENAMEALKICDGLGLDSLSMLPKTTIGRVYRNKEDFDVSENYFKEILELSKSYSGQEGVADAYLNLGWLYQHKGRKENAEDNLNNPKLYTIAKDYFEKALKIYVEIDDQKGLAAVYTNIAIVHFYQKAYDESFKNFQKSLEIEQKNNNILGISQSYINLGSVHYRLKQYDKAMEYYKQALEILKDVDVKGQLADVYNNIYETYKIQGNYQEALKYHELLKEVKEQVNDQSSQRRLARLETQYAFEKQELELQKLQHESEIKEAELREEELKSEQAETQRNISIGGIVLLITLSLLAYRQVRIVRKKNKQIEEQKNTIEEVNKNLEDSISAGRNVQQDTLPNPEDLEKLVKDSFILFKPKDKVSGDFYYLQELDKENVLWIAADCTGHSVQGAFMHMKQKEHLDAVVHYEKNTVPSDILDKVRKRHLESITNEKGGMDCAVCVFDTLKSQLQYAGANNPVYIVRNNNEPLLDEKGEVMQPSLVLEEKYLYEIKADSQPIGDHPKMQPFTNHILDLQEGDSIYTFSDGYADQFGGPKGKKFMSKQLKTLILNIQDQSMQQQKESLNRAIEEWKSYRTHENKPQEQIDDICVIGVKI